MCYLHRNLSWKAHAAVLFGLTGLFAGCATPTTSPDFWKDHEVVVISSEELHLNTVQTKGMTRTEAISRAMAGAEKLWVGKVEVAPGGVSGVHHHGPLETVAYIVSGRSELRWGPNLEHVAEGGPGDFVYVPPYMPHQEINPATDEPLVAIVIRSDQQPISVDIKNEPDN